MNLRLKCTGRRAFVAAALLHCALVHAAGLTNGDFESSPFLTGRSSAGTVTPFAGLAPNSTRSAWLASSGTARVGQDVTWEAEWYLDFYFAITNTANRSFSLLINVGADAAHSGAATINLRCQSGVFNAYSAGSWSNDLGLGTVAPSLDANGAYPRNRRRQAAHAHARPLLTGYYEIDGSLQLRRATNASAETTLRTTYSLSNASFTVDAASVVYTEGANRFRLPKNSAAYDAPSPTDPTLPNSPAPGLRGPAASNSPSAATRGSLTRCWRRRMFPQIWLAGSR